MNATGVTKSRLRSLFEKSPRPIGVVAVYKHFPEIPKPNVNYHLKSLMDEGFLVRPKRGLYDKNPAFKSPEEKRSLVDLHLRTNGSRIQPGPAWKPGDDATKEVVNPLMIPYLARTLGESILDRMKSAGFTPADLRFVEALLQRTYPLSEQQMYQCESLFSGRPTVPSSGASNGHSGNGSS